MQPIIITILTNGLALSRARFMKSWIGHGEIVIYSDKTEVIEFPCPIHRILAPNAWVQTVCQKAYVIKSSLQTYPDRSILFLDSDCWVHKPFDHVWDLDFDVAVTPSGGRHETCTGVIFFRNTLATTLLLNQWIDTQCRMVEQGIGVEPYASAADEKSLDEVAKTSKDAKVRWLSRDYNVRLNEYIFAKQDAPKDKIIYHFAGCAHIDPNIDFFMNQISS